MVRDHHISGHSSSLSRSSYLHIFSRSTSCRKSNFEEVPCVNMEGMDRHGKVAHKDEGIFLAESFGYHRSAHTNEAVSQKLVEGRLPSRTNTCK